MQFYRPRKATPAIPIVSLIDILVILLIFFIVTMQPKQKRTVLDISMPVAGELSTQKVTKRRSVLALAKNGDITINGQRKHSSMLVEFLQILKEDGEEIELEMDKDVRLEQMIQLSEALTKAGFEANLPTRVRDNKTNTQPTTDS